MAAKDAARAYLARQYGLQLYPADVEVFSDARGRPRIRGAWSEAVATMPALAVAHSGIIGAAIAGGTGPDDLLGLEIERIRPRTTDFLQGALSPREREWLSGLSQDAYWEWATRFWCAKEAIVKALGKGLGVDRNDLTIEEIDRETGRLQLRPGEGLARLVPELAHQRLLVYTARDGELAVASTVCERVIDSVVDRAALPGGSSAGQR
jgi:phosphopantetheinyl transferase